MYNESGWWTCPKCKSYKMASNIRGNCIRCAMCGRYFDLKEQEITFKVMAGDVNPQTQCDLK